MGKNRRIPKRIMASDRAKGESATSDSTRGSDGCGHDRDGGPQGKADDPDLCARDAGGGIVDGRRGIDGLTLPQAQGGRALAPLPRKSNSSTLNPAFAR